MPESKEVDARFKRDQNPMKPVVARFKEIVPGGAQPRVRRSSIVTVSPSPFSPRIALATGNSVPCFLSRQTLVRHSRPSMIATTGVRPHGAVAGGACFSGTLAKVQPPGPG